MISIFFPHLPMVTIYHEGKQLLLGWMIVKLRSTGSGIRGLPSLSHTEVECPSLICSRSWRPRLVKGIGDD